MVIAKAVMKAHDVEPNSAEFLSARFMKKRHADLYLEEARYSEDRVSIAGSCSDKSIVNIIITAKKKTGPLNFSMLNKSFLPDKTSLFLVSNNFIINANELLPIETYKLLCQNKWTISDSYNIWLITQSIGWYWKNWKLFSGLLSSLIHSGLTYKMNRSIFLATSSITPQLQTLSQQRFFNLCTNNIFISHSKSILYFYFEIEFKF